MNNVGKRKVDTNIINSIIHFADAGITREKKALRLNNIMKP